MRQRFRRKIKFHKTQGRNIVYIDESGFAKDMPRTHGYSVRGKRCYGTHDWHAKGRTNVIGALLKKSLISLGLFESNVNADIFTAWISQDLLPKLPSKSVIVMDNATFHKRKDTQEIIRNAGHTLLYLPPYSPDLNPIEKKWAQAKAIRRRSFPSVFNLFASYPV